MSKPEDLVLIGKIAQPHGLDGAVRLRPIGEVERLTRLKRLYLDPGGWRAVRSWQLAGADAILRLVGAADRGAALDLGGRDAYAEESALTLDEGEYFYSNLIGRPVVAPDGAPLGRVSDIYDSGPQDLLVIERQGRTFLVPLQAPYVRVLPDAVEVEPLPGLLDDDAMTA